MMGSRPPIKEEHIALDVKKISFPSGVFVSDIEAIVSIEEDPSLKYMVRLKGELIDGYCVYSGEDFVKAQSAFDSLVDRIKKGNYRSTSHISVRIF